MMGTKGGLAVSALAFAIAGSLPASASEIGAFSYGNRLLDDLSFIASRCVVRPYHFDADGTRVDLEPRSLCPELVSADSAHASVSYNGQRFDAELSESELSDGGDLYHLQVRNSQGRVVARRVNVAAFGNILIALAGGEERTREIRE